MDINQVKLCEKWTRFDNLSCTPDDLEFVEKLPDTEKHEPNYKVENYLKACRICGQIYREKIYTYPNVREINLFYKIPGNLINHCHCIGYLIPVEVLKDEKWCEGDSMYFAMEKETKMRCGKCGTYYKERICQSNYDGFYVQTYRKDTK